MPEDPSFTKRLRNRGEAALVDALELACKFLPLRASVHFGERLGGLVGRFDRRRRAVALENLERAFGSALTPEQRAELVAGVYRHLGRFFFEFLLLLARPKLRPFSRFIAIDGLDRARSVVADHGAAIFVTLHQGHWELLGAAVSELVTPLHAVFQPVRNPLLNERVVKLRGRLGMGVIGRENAVPALFRQLRRGHSVALVCDLNQKEGPEFVDFFGVPAATVRTPGVLAVRTGKPVICCGSWSTGEPLAYRALLAPPIVPRPGADPDDEAHRILVEMNHDLEGFVRAHPEQWNWIHPRWKTRPPSESKSAVPRA
jgi:KDO2-lipid IV(A) lauroyltransferase